MSTRLLAMALAAVLLLALCADPRSSAGDPVAPAVPETEDWIAAEISKEVVEDGPISWDGFGIGTTIELRMQDAPDGGFGTTESRATLVGRDETSVTVRRQFRDSRKPGWGPAVDRPLPRGPAKDATRRVEDLGSESVEVAGRSVSAKKSRWTRWVGGRASKPEFVVWFAGARLVKWTVDRGDGWTSTFTAAPDEVEWRLGDATFRAREVSEAAESSFLTMQKKSLWVREIPEHVVRQTTTSRGPGGAPGAAQTLEMTRFERKDADHARDGATSGATKPVEPKAGDATPKAPKGETPAPR